MSNLKNTKPMIVLGMHRSGTSAVSGVFSELGIFMGKNLFQAQKGVNDKGFFENSAVVSINENIFKVLHSSWDSPLGQLDKIKLDELGSDIQSASSLLLTEYADQAYWGIKDPRTSVLLPFWQHVFKLNELTPHYTIMIRHPLEVYQSLRRRDCFSMEKSLIIWCHYTLASFRYFNSTYYQVLQYDALMNDTKKSVEAIIAQYEPSLVSKVENATGFISDKLRNYSNQDYTIESNDPIGKIAQNIYEAVSKVEIDIAEIKATEKIFTSYIRSLEGVISEHLKVVKQEELRYRELFDEAYTSIWWKLSWPLRATERLLKK